MRRFLFSLLAALVATPLQADELLLKSGPEQVGLLELYTSEGCSSCPPADRWLRSLAERPGLFSEFIPVAFHVDYWDYIGWKDRFASAAYSDRQRRYAQLGGVSTVYTPGFVYNGREWRRFFGGGGGFPRGMTTGELEARLHEATVELEFRPSAETPAALVGNVALLGFGLRSEVTAGENRGRELRHDFVVLAHAASRLTRDQSGHRGRVSMPASTVEAERYALVAWVSSEHHPAPLQAAGAYLPIR